MARQATRCLPKFHVQNESAFTNAPAFASASQPHADSLNTCALCLHTLKQDSWTQSCLILSCRYFIPSFFQQVLNLLSQNPNARSLSLLNQEIRLNHSRYTEANWLQAMTNFCFLLPLFLNVLKYLLPPAVITCFFRNESLALNLSQKTLVIMYILSTFRCSSEPQCSRDSSTKKN